MADDDERLDGEADSDPSESDSSPVVSSSSSLLEVADVGASAASGARFLDKARVACARASTLSVRTLQSWLWFAPATADAVSLGSFFSFLLFSCFLRCFSFLFLFCLLDSFFSFFLFLLSFLFFLRTSGEGIPGAGRAARDCGAQRAGRGAVPLRASLLLLCFVLLQVS